MKIDMHVHTCYSSDSSLQLSDIVSVVNEGRLDGVAITDHNEIIGAQKLQQMASFPVIVGEEIMTESGEIIGLFLKKRISPGLSLIETIDCIKEQEGLVAVPHPFDRLRSSAINITKLNTIINHIDLLEAFNSRNIFSKDNSAAAFFAEQNGIAKIAGSDAHTKSEIGAAYIAIMNFANPEEFMASISNADIFTSKSPISVHLKTKVKKVIQSIS
jgi:predicted metal-dependent phosphoesterase TrpH